jgi:hypothetical protein
VEGRSGTKSHKIDNPKAIDPPTIYNTRMIWFFFICKESPTSGTLITVQFLLVRLRAKKARQAGRNAAQISIPPGAIKS